MDLYLLKDYLFKTRKMENDIYIMESYLNKLSEKHNIVKKDDSYYKSELGKCEAIKRGNSDINLTVNFDSESEKEKKLIPNKGKLLKSSFWKASIITTIFYLYIYLKDQFTPLECSPILAVVWILIFLFSYKKKYKKELYSLRREEKADAAIEILTAKIEANRPVHDKYEKIKATLDEALSIAKEQLSELYQAGVVFPKYRNVIAINQIAEYLDSGRCESLEGEKGAYNLFESELRKNLIILKMEGINENLEQIKKTQYYAYEVVAESNNIINGENISEIITHYKDIPVPILCE